MNALAAPGPLRRGFAELTGVETWVLDCLQYMPMGSAQDISFAFGRDASVVYRTLAALETAGYVAGRMMSCHRRRQKRWWIKGRDGRDRPGFVSFAHSSNAVAKLLDNPVATEWFYYLASGLAVTPYGKSIDRRMLEFCWFRDRAFDAAARYTDGWVAFFWSGYWQDSRLLEHRLGRINEGMRSYGGRARPGLYCFVVPDLWQAYLVWDAAQRLNLAGAASIQVIDGVSSLGDFEILQDSEGWLLPGIEGDPVGVTPLERVFNGSLINEPDGAWLLRLMFHVEQWPGVTRKTLAGFTRQSNGRVKAGLDRLLDRGMVVDHDGRYVPAGVWLSGAARRDRVWSGRPGRHFSHEIVENLYDGRIQRHEQGLMRVMRAFAKAGCPVASGWRAYDVMGTSGQVAPDGVVFLQDSPFGSGWHYVEYELRAKGKRLVDAKLRGYRSRVRANDYPVLMVCSPEAEGVFLERGAGLKMLVTTVPEVRSGLLVSDGARDTVWRFQGEPVRVLQ